METYSFTWVLTRAEFFGWELQKVTWRTKRVFMGKQRPTHIVEVLDKRVHTRWLDQFDEWVRENLNEEFFDGSEY
jgi:hypothetical protein